MYENVLLPVLSVDEKDRADRFHFARHRLRFAAGRFFLRQVLAGYLGRPPAAVQFRYESYGKPALADAAGLEFNLSHSEDLALLAVSSAPLGVDVEYLHEVDVARLSQRFFFPAESAALARTGPAERLTHFFRLWTAKEACLKAGGEGLHALQTVEIQPPACQPAAVWSAIDHRHAAPWHILPLSVPDKYVAALATAMIDPEVEYFQFLFPAPKGRV